MKLISLGGIGGCDLAQALRELGQPSYPYDWIISTQSFVINSFNNFNNFFVFDERYVWNYCHLCVNNKNALMLHDFNNLNDFTLKKEELIAKYKRRFQRVNDCLHGDEEILFVRIYDNLQDQINSYNDVLIRDNENVEQWESFINSIQIKYNKKIKLLIITNKKDICTKTYDNIIMHFTEEHKNPKINYKIVQDTMKFAFEIETCNK
jgi:hypothetical protein